MGRPSIKEEDKRTVQVNIRLTQSENKKVCEYAAAGNLSPANWIRQKVFTGKFPNVKTSPLDADIYRELQKIGVNLNQATHKINSGQMPENYRPILLVLYTQVNKIIKLLVNDSGSGER